jgi:polymorphic membrane protein
VGLLAVGLAGVAALAACGSPARPAADRAPAPAVTTSAPTPAPTPAPTTSRPPARPLPSAGTLVPAPRTTTAAAKPGGAAAPIDTRGVDTSHPDRVVGSGSPAGCTSAAVVAAVAAGGVITFDCGPAPVTIAMTQTAKIVNAHPRTVLDGGGKVTLSGGGQRRILYQNTCDQKQGYTTSHCQDQETPELVVQNLTFANGNSTGELTEGGGGGAIFVRGGRFSVIGSRFVGNRCDPTGPDLGGAALRVLSQYHGQPVRIVGSTFTGGVCSNGGALSSIGVSWDIADSTFTGNKAIGSGANPARPGTPGGGSGGAIYLDGNTFTLRIAGSRITGNSAAEGGGAIFFVSNDRTGTATVTGSTISGNPSAGFETAGLPGWFFLGARPPSIS